MLLIVYILAKDGIFPTGPYSIVQSESISETIKFNQVTKQFEHKLDSETKPAHGLLQVVLLANSENQYPCIPWRNRKTNEIFLTTCRTCCLQRQEYCTHTKIADKAFEVSMKVSFG